ncbi:CDP-glycerol glycerophosphotransferase family protein [Helicobacter sp.]|uniref:CDP-glycerol glycerophosphotransferase family protein n=1 Tax=Helicobacter sp. TaxID=218 RepID=UPI00258C6B18|nr:CDP-glycerol glycerophosphotransferase family protein [Helicobacter sp.]MCI7766328.1 CDP-glycerol glycerophosphotransferase family protein [Helicobacter sp.]
MPLITAKKLEKLIRDPRLFFQDAFKKRLIPLGNALKKYKPKKYKGYSKYVIVSAVYNVEKYLDDYFKSIINQRLDFKKNIHIVCVDDGSIDNSAKIIKSYQKKYPKNITYLYKENGGQASARNLGLKYLQENESLRDKFAWVTFTDPDDFLDNGYFYEVDEFLVNHQDDDICMIGCNIIFYHEKQKLYKDNHALNFKFKNGVQIRENYNLDNFIQLSAASCFINLTFLNNLIFDEKLKPNFEDAKFINEYLLENIDLKSVFLPSVKYFYRKREEGNSTLDLKLIQKDYYLNVAKNGYLNILENAHFKFGGHIPLFIQNLVLYDLCWQIKPLINSPEKLSILNESEQQEYLNLLDKIFSFIEIETVVNFSLAGCWFFYKVGILNCFKNERPPFQIAYIEDYDPYKEQILITYYTKDDKDIESILIDRKKVYADYKKIVKYDFLDRVFCYQKRLWVSIPKDAKDKLEMFNNNEQSMVGKYGEYFLDIKDIRKEFQKRLPKSNIWLLMDRDYEADDNAEHLYRYIMQNHPKQKIVFALRKESSDWKRLKREGFNLVEFGSYKFRKIVNKSSKIISSHADSYLMRYIGLSNQFIFIQHGVTQNDISKWLNSRRISLFIVANQAEYDSVVNDYGHYKFSKKEVFLTGFARHDTLLKNNQNSIKQVLVMPTWRHYLSGLMIGNSGIRKLKDGFRESEYFQKWNSLLNSDVLQKLCKKYSYAIVFNPHPNIIPYLKDFEIPSYVSIANENKSLQDLFCKSSLMITDYSSVAFEMAYLGKSVIYYQFDKEEFFSSHTLQKGYFDYEKDGFGPVVENEENLLKQLENFLRNDCKSFGVYKDNINSAFVFKDGRCCERIYKILNKDIYGANSNFNGM